MIKWIPGVPPLNELKENELILVIGEWDGKVGNPFIAEYAERMLSDHYDREPFYEGNVIKWSRIEGEPEPELSDGHKEDFNRLMYGLTKTAARESFVEWLDKWGVAEEDYDVISKYLKDKYGVKTYV